MKRYLCHYGYIGTRFGGIQKNENLKHKSYAISHILEESLLSLSPRNRATVYCSSRTDRGVHAGKSSFHCDLELPPVRLPHGFTKNDFIQYKLNEFMERYNFDIRVQSVQPVSLNFHCRYLAEQRTYLYRLVHVKSEKLKCLTPLPIIELHRSQLVRGKFDVEAIKKACLILKGRHNFRYFAKINKDEYDDDIRTERSLDELKIVPWESGRSEVYGDLYADIRHWDIIISAKAFLRNQVRRIVGLLLSVGQGKTSLTEVKETIVYPYMNWDPQIQVAEAGGLYLLNVQYPDIIKDCKEAVV